MFNINTLDVEIFSTIFGEYTNYNLNYTFLVNA